MAFSKVFDMNLSPLSTEKAHAWLNLLCKNKCKSEANTTPDCQKPIKATAKKDEKSSADRNSSIVHRSDFRLVKTQREAKQRPSYTTRGSQ
jgi:hypothetical protein